MKKHNIKKGLMTALIAVLSLIGVVTSGRVVNAAGEVGFSVSPMKQEIVLNPGDSYRGTFTVSNPASSPNDFSFVFSVFEERKRQDKHYNIQHHFVWLVAEFQQNNHCTHS